MGLQEKLNQLKAGFEAKAPKEALEVMHGATRDLRNSGIMDRVVKVGDTAPDFELKNADDLVRIDTNYFSFFIPYNIFSSFHCLSPYSNGTDKNSLDDQYIL